MWTEPTTLLKYADTAVSKVDILVIGADPAELGTAKYLQQLVYSIIPL